MKKRAQMKSMQMKKQFVIFNPWKVRKNWIAFSQNSFVMSSGLLYHLIRRDTGRLANEAFTLNPIVSSNNSLAFQKFQTEKVYEWKKVCEWKVFEWKVHELKIDILNLKSGPETRDPRPGILGPVTQDSGPGFLGP